MDLAHFKLGGKVPAGCHVRGTAGVPPGIPPSMIRPLTLAYQDASGTERTTPAQLRVLARRAGGGLAAIEVAARLVFPPAENTVLRLIDVTPVKQLSPQAAHWPVTLLESTKLMLGSREIGRPCSAAYSVELDRSGPILLSALLQGQDKESGLGWRAHVTHRFKSELIEIELQCYAGWVGNPVNAVSLSEGLTIDAPSGWTVVRRQASHMLGHVIADVGAPSLPGRGSLRVELCITRNSNPEVEAWKAGYDTLFCVPGGVLGWWGEAGGLYACDWPAPLPYKDPTAQRAAYAIERVGLGLKLVSGSPLGDLEHLGSDAAGPRSWHRTLWPQYGGVSGGLGIGPWYGIDALSCQSGERLCTLALAAELLAQRQKMALYQIGGWRQNGLEIQGWHSHNFGFVGDSSTDPSEFKTSETNTDYVSKWEPIDWQHSIRVLGPLKALAWLRGDLWAISMIHEMAEWALVTWGAGSDGGRLSALIGRVTTSPKTGTSLGRGEAWAIDALCCSYALGDDVRRMRLEPVLRNWYQVLVKSATPRGPWQAELEYKPALSLPGNDIMDGPKARYGAGQVFEACITAHAMACLTSQLRSEAFGYGWSNLHQQMHRIANYCWPDGADRPYYIVATCRQVSPGAFEQLEPPVDCSSAPDALGYQGRPGGEAVVGGDTWQTPLMAYGDPSGPLLDRLKIALGNDLIAGLEARGPGALINTAPLIAWAQKK